VSLNRQSYKLPATLSGAVKVSLEDWKANNKVKRLWQHDASVWTGADEGNWLGWLDVTGEQLARIDVLKSIGPRFLHSTGQAYKGGPNSGVFLQITCDAAVDLPVPGQKYTFGTMKAAQARGDFAVLAERGRRALRVHLGKNVNKDLAKLGAALGQALK
jgi:hypothetical protein